MYHPKIYNNQNEENINILILTRSGILIKSKMIETGIEIIIAPKAKPRNTV